jgi:hypothetical protein
VSRIPVSRRNDKGEAAYPSERIEVTDELGVHAIEVRVGASELFESEELKFCRHSVYIVALLLLLLHR